MTSFATTVAYPQNVTSCGTNQTFTAGSARIIVGGVGRDCDG